MTGFWLAVAGLVALAAWMLRPSRGGLDRADASRTSSLGLLKGEWSTLDAELANGRLSREAHQAARDELQRRVLAEAPAAPIPLRAGNPARSWLLASLGVPLFALALYGSLGNLAAIGTASAPAVAAPQPPADDGLAAMVDTLAGRLAAEPELAQDVSAWTMLARAYAGMQRFADASSAYARATALSPDDVQLLADHADVLAMLQGGRLAGEPQRLIDRALAIDSNNLKALALAGSAAFERKDNAAATGYWQRARERAPAGSAFATSLDRSLASARSPASAEPASAAAPSAARVAARIAGRASLAPELASRIAPGDTVFITARAVDGPRMPLAVLRRSAAELPFDFSLDESMAMSPEATLAAYPHVVLSARISRSGQGMPQPGDPYGQASADAGSGRSVDITIDKLQP